MLAPLDERILRSLVEYDKEFEYTMRSDPRDTFGINCVSGGLQFIFHRFRLFGALLDTPGATGGAEWPDPPYWRITFRERPWKHLSIRPDPAEKSSCRVFEGEKYIKTYKMLGCPDHWVDLVRWLWNYGNERAMALEAMDARRAARKNSANPAFSLSPRRPNSRSRHKPPPSSPARPASHVLRRTGLRPYQGIKCKGKRRASLLSVMTLPGIEEDTRFEGQVSEEVLPKDGHVLQEKDVVSEEVLPEDGHVLQEKDVVSEEVSPGDGHVLHERDVVSEEVLPEDGHILQERNVNRRKASEISPKEGTVENMELGSEDTHETYGDEVG